MGLYSDPINSDTQYSLDQQRRIEDLRRRGLLTPDVVRLISSGGSPSMQASAGAPAPTNDPAASGGLLAGSAPGGLLAPSNGAGAAVMSGAGPSPVGGLLAAPEAAPTPRGGLLGGLDRGYAAVDHFLPGDSVLDPMFNGGSQGGGAGADPFQPKAHHFNPLRAADSFLGLGIGNAIDSEHQRNLSADLRDQIHKVGTDSTLDADRKLATMKRLVQDAQARGLNAGPWLEGLATAEDQLKRKKWLDSLPPDQRVEAAADPSGYMGEARIRGRPQYMASDNPITAINPTGGPGGGPLATQLTNPPPKPGNLSMDDERARVIQEARRVGPDNLNPVDRKLYNDIFYHPDSADSPLSTDRVTAAALDKWVRGETLTPNEQSLVEIYKQRNQSNGLLEILLGGGLPGVPGVPGVPRIGGPTPTTGAPPPSPLPRAGPSAPPRAARSKGNGSVGQPFTPASEADFKAIPKGTYYVDPGDGQVYQKVR